MFNMSQWSSTYPEKYTGATLEGICRCWRVSADARRTNPANGVAGHPSLSDKLLIRDACAPDQVRSVMMKFGWRAGTPVLSAPSSLSDLGVR
jgi:hypothetical protein